MRPDNFCDVGGVVTGNRKKKVLAKNVSIYLLLYNSTVIVVVLCILVCNV